MGRQSNDTSFETQSARQHAILSAFARIFREALTCETEEALGEVCLAAAEEVTGSRFGFIGEVDRRTGKLCDIAISDPGWALCTMQVKAGHGKRPPAGFAIHGLYGRVLQSGEGFFTNEPPAHPDSIGTPAGHPPLTAFLGVPLIQAGRTVGMMGLGNREGGYGEAELEAAQALAPAVVQAFQSKRAEEALRQSESFHRQTLESIPGMVFTTRPDGYCDYQSQQWVDYTGVPFAEQLGDGWNQLLHPEDRARAFEAWRAAVEERGPYDLEYRVRRRDGEYEWFRVMGRPIRDPAGKIVRWFGAAMNVEELKRTERALSVANDQLLEADLRKNEFIAVLSHELRNPLAPIKNSLFILDRAAPGSEQAARAKQVLDRQVAQLSRLIDDLLDITRITRNKVVLQRGELDLNALVQAVAEDQRSLFDERSLALEVRLSPASLWVEADDARLAQVVSNLLQNAVKFTGPGGRAQVSVERDPEARQAVVRVRDTGRGMDPATIARLFEPFMQADSTLDRRAGGLGLGLALTKGLVELHGGQVSARSEGLGKGSELEVRLPLLGSVAEALASPQASPPGGRRRVLVIEDNVDAADSLCAAIELVGHTVQVAYDGRQGLALAPAFCPDVVLCDIGLPGMDGYALARAMRADQGLAGVRLVALTGYALPEDLKRAIEAGFDRHLAKPPDLETLWALLCEAP